ncbi:hypothetical protein HMPREF1548_06833 [Clostridium sp. KLE 1755]|nr:hypothetical protein HMPREF1548_06833 [Clostridium sp. KLE 1755]
MNNNRRSTVLVSHQFCRRAAVFYIKNSILYFSSYISLGCPAWM